jgi:hypothetical protein
MVVDLVEENHERNKVELFKVEAKNYSLQVLVNTKFEDPCHELELLGSPVRMSRFELLQTEYGGKIALAI